MNCQTRCKDRLQNTKGKKKVKIIGRIRKEQHILPPMIHQIAPASHSALCLLISFHNDPQDQPFVQIIQYVYTCAEKVLIASEEVFQTMSLLHSTQKKKDEKKGQRGN